MAQIKARRTDRLRDFVTQKEILLIKRCGSRKTVNTQKPKVCAESIIFGNLGRLELHFPDSSTKKYLYASHSDDSWL